jgi:hypothetical protein
MTNLQNVLTWQKPVASNTMTAASSHVVFAQEDNQKSPTPATMIQVMTARDWQQQVVI